MSGGILASKNELKDAYNGVYNQKTLAIKVVQSVVHQLKSFLLGDGTRKIQIIASDSANQKVIDNAIAESSLLNVLEQAYDEVLVYGDAYVDYSQAQLRLISQDNIDEVVVDPDNPHRVVYLREKRQRYNTSTRSTEDYPIEYSLELPQFAVTGRLDLLDLPDYEYRLRVNGEDLEANGKEIPIIRLVNSLKGSDAESPIEPIIHCQLEYNEIRSRIHTLGKHMKPLMYSIGTSAPKVIGRSNKQKPAEVSSAEGQYLFQTSFSEEATAILHFPIGPEAMEMGVTPKIGYLQAQDTPYLERQRLIVLQDIYNLSGAVVLELQNARSASSSSSLAILYEPLVKFTAERAKYLIQGIQQLLVAYGVDRERTPYRIELPNMRPTDADERRAKAELVEKRIMSRHRFLTEVLGLSAAEADKEIDQLIKESVLNVQYSETRTDAEENTGDFVVGAIAPTAPVPGSFNDR